MKTIFNLILVAGLAAFAAQAQDEVPPPMPAVQTFSDAQLDQLLGPVALYPDPLIAVLLPSATLPTQIVMADRYLQNGGDPSAIDQQGWDPNVQALAHYPDVLKWMDDNLAWTTQLGEAFQNQQQSTMDSVQRLRTQAYNLGNLVSTPQQQVVDDDGYIEILPVNPNNLYVPDYQPQQVYYQPPSGPPYITFSVGFIIGPWLCCDFDWYHRHLVVWTRDHPRPHDYWHERPQQRYAYVQKQTTFWTPGHHAMDSREFQGDRGWNNNQDHRGWENNQDHRDWTVPNMNRTTPAPALNQHPGPTLSQHPGPTTSGHPMPTFSGNENTHNNNAFIGIQSAHDTRDYSERGQESVHNDGHIEAPSSTAPSYHGENNAYHSGGNSVGNGGNEGYRGGNAGNNGGGNNGGGNSSGGYHPSGGGNANYGNQQPVGGGGGGGGGGGRH